GLALVAQRRWRLGALVTIVSAAWFIVTLKLIIPAFAGGAPYQYLDRYASLGGNELEIARTLLLDPLRVLRVLLSGEVGSKIAFVLTLFAPGLGLALRARSALIPSIVPLGYLLLSDYGGQHTHHNQYGAPVIPLAASISSRDFFTTQVPERRLNYHLNGLDPCAAQYVILDYADPSVNRDEQKHLAEVATLEAQGYDEVASGKGLSLLRHR